MSYTPGPWSLSDFATVSGASKEWVIECDDGRKSVVFLTQLSMNQEYGRFDDNARLIAAAPELVEALQDILNRCVAGSHDFDGAIRSMNPTQDGHALIAARALLARIKGEA